MSDITEVSTEIKPCPFCGGKAMLVPIGAWNLCRAGYCTDCEVYGPSRSTEHAAVEAWNLRTLSPAALSTDTTEQPRSVQRRIAAQNGLPVPDFSAPAEQAGDASRESIALALAVLRRDLKAGGHEEDSQLVGAAISALSAPPLDTQKADTTQARDAEMNARYESGWYFCWLIERRDLPQPEWFGAVGFWHRNANDACWFARKEDAEASAAECPYDVIVCEHGFAIAKETTK